MAQSYWLRSGFYSLLQKATTMILGVLSYIVLVQKVLTKEEIGVWILFQSVTLLIEIGRNGLIRSSLIKYIGESSKSEIFKINTASLFINTSITILSYLLLLLIAPYLSELVNAPKLTILLYYYGITSLVLIPFSQLNFLQQANLTFAGITLAHFIRTITFFGGIVIQAYTSIDFTPYDLLVFLVLLQTLGILLGSVSNFFMCRKFLHYSSSLDWHWVKKLFNFGKFTFITNLSTILYNKTDQIMLGALINPAAVAVHNMAIRINMIALMPSLSIAEVVYPKSIERYKDKGPEVLVHLYYRSMGAILGIILPVCVLILLFPEPIIKILAGNEFEEYAMAVPILRFTVLYMIFSPSVQQMAVIIEAYGKPQVNTRIELISASVNVISNLIFILQFGILGAIYGTLTSMFIKYLIMSTYIRRTLSINPLKSTRYILPFYTDIVNTVRQKLGKSA